MTAFRLISLPTHGAIEFATGLALLFGPFALTLGAAATVIGVGLGVLLVGLALGTAETLPVAAHLAFDQALVAGMLAAAVATAVAGDNAGALFFAAASIAHLTLVMTTKYSRRQQTFPK